MYKNHSILKRQRSNTNESFDEKMPISKKEEALDEKINEKKKELKKNLTKLIKDNMYYINNANSIKNAEKYIKYNKDTIDIETEKDNFRFIKYYINEIDKTKILLSKLINNRDDNNWNKIKSVLQKIQTEDKDNIYMTVFNMLTQENKDEKITEQATIRAEYLYYCQFKNDATKKQEIDMALEIIKKYQTMDPDSFEFILKSISSREKKNPTAELLKTHNDELKIPFVKDAKVKQKKMRFTTPCTTDNDCNKETNEKCIQEVCSGMKGIEISDMYAARLAMFPQGRPLSQYPTSVRKKRDKDTNKLI